eukprot:SAG11_NODE_3259_length_2573_cov_1.385206_2_plen_99_part_00
MYVSVQNRTFAMVGNLSAEGAPVIATCRSGAGEQAEALQPGNPDAEQGGFFGMAFVFGPAASSGDDKPGLGCDARGPQPPPGPQLDAWGAASSRPAPG